MENGVSKVVRTHVTARRPYNIIGITTGFIYVVTVSFSLLGYLACSIGATDLISNMDCVGAFCLSKYRFRLGEIPCFVSVFVVHKQFSLATLMTQTDPITFKTLTMT